MTFRWIPDTKGLTEYTYWIKTLIHSLSQSIYSNVFIIVWNNRFQSFPFFNVIIYENIYQQSTAQKCLNLEIFKDCIFLCLYFLCFLYTSVFSYMVSRKIFTPINNASMS